MADLVVATFAPLNATVPAAQLRVQNDSGLTLDVDRFGISGRTAKFPVTWDGFAVAADPTQSVVSISGVGDEVVFVTLNNFDAGDFVTFTVDADFTGDPNPPSPSVVRVLDISGARAMVVFSDNTTAFGVFEPAVDGSLRAVMLK